MVKQPIHLQRAALLIVGAIWVAAMTATPTHAQQPPPVPHAFYGSVEVNGQPAAVGAKIEARGAGVKVGIQGNPLTMTVAGRYGGRTLGEPKLGVQGPIADKAPIEFYIDGVKAECARPGGPWQSSYPFAAGVVTELNLRVAQNAAPTATPTSTPLPTAIERVACCRGHQYAGTDTDRSTRHSHAAQHDSNASRGKRHSQCYTAGAGYPAGVALSDSDRGGKCNDYVSKSDANGFLRHQRGCGACPSQCDACREERGSSDRSGLSHAGAGEIRRHRGSARKCRPSCQHSPADAHCQSDCWPPWHQHTDPGFRYNRKCCTCCRCSGDGRLFRGDVLDSPMGRRGPVAPCVRIGGYPDRPPNAQIRPRWARLRRTTVTRVCPNPDKPAMIVTTKARSHPDL